MPTNTDDAATGQDVPPGTGEDTEAARRDLVEWLSAALDVWRSKIDDLLVQADLASKDLGDELRGRAAVAENAYLAARRRLGDLPRDAGASLGSIRAGMESLMGDLRRAYEAAEAVVRRGGAA
jgi:hypothetical protein